MSSKKKNDDYSFLDEVQSVLQDKSYQSQAKRGEATGLYVEEPVDIDTFFMHPDYMGMCMSMDEDDPDCHRLSDSQRRVLIAADNLENGINHLVLMVGKGGGKGFTTRTIFLRLAYRLLCMRNPHAYFGQPATEYFTFLNVASSADQANRAFFQPLKSMLRRCGPKAFRQFGFDPDRDIKDRLISMPKLINIVSGHSEADSLEGSNILVAVADEIDGNSFKKPDKMWNMLISSSRSRFSGKEKIFAISYPRYGDSNGMIAKLYDQYYSPILDDLPIDQISSEAIGTNGAAYKFPTWIFNPLEKVTRESLQDQYDKNPEWAESVYGCNPPESSMDAFIKDRSRVEEAMNKDGSKWPLKFPIPSDNFLSFPVIEARRFIDGKEVVLDPYNLEFEDWFRGIPGVTYAFCGDPGLGSVQNGGDAYGICLGHREVVYDENGKKMWRPVVDFVFRFTGYMFPEREIQFDAIHNLIVQLKENLGFDIKLFAFDLWQSTSTSQWLRRRYKSDVYITNTKYVTYDMYTLFRERIFGEAPPSSGQGEKLSNGGMGMLWHPILYWEIVNLIEDRQRGKVDHRDDTSKDLCDPVVNFAYHAIKRWPYAGIEIKAGSLDGEIARAKVPNPIPDDDPLHNMVNRLEKMSRDLRAPLRDGEGLLENNE